MHSNARIASELMSIARDIARTAASKGPAVERPALEIDRGTGRLIVISRINPKNGEQSLTTAAHLRQADKYVENVVEAIANAFPWLNKSYDILHALGEFNSTECVYAYVDIAASNGGGVSPKDALDALDDLGIEISPEAEKRIGEMFPDEPEPETETEY